MFLQHILDANLGKIKSIYAEYGAGCRIPALDKPGIIDGQNSRGNVFHNRFEIIPLPGFHQLTFFGNPPGAGNLPRHGVERTQ